MARRNPRARRPPTRSRSAETSLADADRAARQALEAMSVAREQRAASEERLEGARARDEELKHAIASELDCEPAGLAALADHKADKPLPGGVEVERKLENLRQERERLGAVNLRADEELVEVLASRDKLISERDDLTEAIKRLRERDRHPQSGGARAACRRFRCRQRPFQGSVLDPVRGRQRRAAADRIRGSARGGTRASRPAAGQEAADADASFGRRAGADRACAHLRRVPHQSGADLRARRGRRAAR